MKRFLSLFFSFMIVFSFCVPCFADDSDSDSASDSASDSESVSSASDDVASAPTLQTAGVTSVSYYVPCVGMGWASGLTSNDSQYYSWNQTGYDSHTDSGYLTFYFPAYAIDWDYVSSDIVYCLDYSSTSTLALGYCSGYMGYSKHILSSSAGHSVLKGSASANIGDGTLYYFSGHQQLGNSFSISSTSITYYYVAVPVISDAYHSISITDEEVCCMVFTEHFSSFASALNSIESYLSYIGSLELSESSKLAALNKTLSAYYSDIMSAIEDQSADIEGLTTSIAGLGLMINNLNNEFDLTLEGSFGDTVETDLTAILNALSDFNALLTQIKNSSSKIQNYCYSLVSDSEDILSDTGDILSNTNTLVSSLNSVLSDFTALLNTNSAISSKLSTIISLLGGSDDGADIVYTSGDFPVGINLGYTYVSGSPNISVRYSSSDTLYYYSGCSNCYYAPSDIVISCPLNQGWNVSEYAFVDGSFTTLHNYGFGTSSSVSSRSSVTIGVGHYFRINKYAFSSDYISTDVVCKMISVNYVTNPSEGFDDSEILALLQDISDQLDDITDLLGQIQDAIGDVNFNVDVSISDLNTNFSSLQSDFESVSSSVPDAGSYPALVSLGLSSLFDFGGGFILWCLTFVVIGTAIIFIVKRL